MFFKGETKFKPINIFLRIQSSYHMIRICIKNKFEKLINLNPNKNVVKNINITLQYIFIFFLQEKLF